jgi:hypothetical protein
MSRLHALPASDDAKWEPVAPEKILSGAPQTRT